LLLEDQEDLIHKATGWMLREVGDRNRGLLIDFLKPIYRKCHEQCSGMPLRNLAKFSENAYLKGRM